MKILIVTVYYPPVISSLSVMMKEVAEDLCDKGHEVTLATSKPHSDLNLTKDQLDTQYKIFSIENKVRVIRVPTPPLKSKFYIIRGLVQFLLPYIFYRKIIKSSPSGFDKVIISTPPLHLTKIGKMLKNRFDTKFILFVQDIYPQSVIDVGAMKNKIFIKYFERISQEAYKNADLITSHTKGNRKFLIENNDISPHKIYYLPNWIDLNLYSLKDSQKISFRSLYGIEKKFIFLFAGVFGLGQGLEYFVDGILQIKKIPEEFVFLFVGEGSEKNKIEKKIRDNNSNNFIFKPFIPLEEYPALVNEVDIGLVCLDQRISTPVVPGKLLGFMASSLPVFGLLNKESDGHDIIKYADCGFSIISGSSYDIIEKTLNEIYNNKDKLKKMGRSGFEYVSKYYNKDKCINDIYKILSK